MYLYWSVLIFAAEDFLKLKIYLCVRHISIYKLFLVWAVEDISSPEFLLKCRYKSNIHIMHGRSHAGQISCMADLTPEIHAYINLYVIGCPNCTVLAYHGPYQQSHLSFKLRSRSSTPSSANSSLDLMVAVSCSFTLQICLTIVILLQRLGVWLHLFGNGQVSPAWSIVLYTKALHTWFCVLKERWQEVAAPQTSSRWFSHMLW